jgi:hypothetical protein
MENGGAVQGGGGGAESPARRRRLWPWILLLLSVLFCFVCGFYSVQPIGAIPDGATAIVLRAEGEPFFNSPDALCLERMGGASLLCRSLAMAQAPTDRILIRLPYQQWAYDFSTGGQRFDR